MNKFPSAALPQAVRCLAVAALLPALLGGAAPSSKEAAPKARKILARAEQIRSPEQDYTVELSLKVTDPTTYWKERGAAYMLIAHGKDYSFIMMREPKTFYSGTLLIDRGLYWLLLPRSQKPVQLAARQVLSGDIANGDLARGNLMKYYDVRLDGEEVVREEPCWRLELTRTDRLGMYKRIRAWITKKHFRAWKSEYYGETDTLLRVAHYEDYRETPLGVRSMRMVVKNSARPAEQTVLTFSNLRALDASGLDFSPEGMPAFRDAAQAKLKADRVPAQAEDLLTILVGDKP